MIDRQTFGPQTAAYYTLGCKLNFAETSTIGRMLEERGIRRARNGEPVDICIINTCSVTELADKKCRQTIRRISRQHPEAVVVVTGCYAQLKPEEIARIPGERAKVAVESYDERIDPVGACVGMKGSRIYGIVKELRNENIDVVNYTANPSLMIQRALNPAKISSITIDEEKMTASVYLKPDQVSLAIGKGGLNIRLSKMLTGYDIDVYREVEEEDVALTEFADEIDGWVIDALKAAGCDTAKSVLELPVEEIAARADLELEQAQKVVEILKAEFE